MLPSAQASAIINHSHRKEQARMSTYPASDLLRLWSLGEVTPEQTIGHLVQHLVTITQRLTDLEKRLRQVEQQHSTQP